jgi:hypothetical protein
MMSVIFCGVGLFAQADPAADAVTIDKVVRPDHLGAVGRGVSDLARSTRFYEEILGVSVFRVYELGYINEKVLGFLQQYLQAHGATHVPFSPLDFISNLTVLILKPRHHLARYHGAFARGCHQPNAKMRQRIVPAAKQQAK